MTIYGQLKSQAEVLAGLLNRREGISVERLPDVVEDQIASEQRSITAETLTKLSYRLDDTLRALEKYQEGTYAVCDDCDAEIPQKRTTAVPEAVRCISCQMAVDDRRNQPSDNRYFKYLQ